MVRKTAIWTILAMGLAVAAAEDGAGWLPEELL
jgi:hypothetical protein